jgi:translation initiation factor 2 subunit 1
MIESMKGRFKIKMEPKVVTDLDEAELARQMDMLEAENEQIAGDTDSEEDSDSSEEDDDEQSGASEKANKKKSH